jgi:acyl-CoA synthetase (AMP-forming)/AMP-acid ligase II
MQNQPSEVGALLRQRAAEHPDRTLFRYLTFDGKEPQQITYGGLLARAGAIAASLTARGLRQRPVLLIYPTGPDFAPAFFGVMLARAIAVPAPFPTLEGHFRRLEGIAIDCQPGAVMSTASMLAKLGDVLPAGSPLRTCPWIATDEDSAAVSFEIEPGAPSDIAVLQYTSGSTADPRGVMVTHGNLVHNAVMIDRIFQIPPQARGICWLPHFHDMGLVGGLVVPLVCSGESILMSPESFQRRPLRWLEAISQYRAQICGGPNFAYDLCVRWADRGNLPALDLSSWQTAFVGAEPVRAATMRAFADRFRDSGFQASAMTPCYGMAEATLLVTCTPHRGGASVHSLSRHALERGEATPSAGADALKLVGAGQPAAGTTVRIVDPESGKVLGNRQMGEIWVSGPQVARGYWGKDEDGFTTSLGDSTATRFLRTGDLGFLTEDGELVFVDRLKDVVVFNGQKYACYDLELTAGTSHEALSADGCVAVSLEGGDKPHLVVIAELPPSAMAQAEDVARAIRAAWFTTYGLPARTVAFVPRGKLSRTTSGKLQRRLSANRLKAGETRILALSGEALPQAAACPAGG